jgi:hypothetical protein
MRLWRQKPGLTFHFGEHGDRQEQQPSPQSNEVNLAQAVQHLTNRCLALGQPKPQPAERHERQRARSAPQ